MVSNNDSINEQPFVSIIIPTLNSSGTLSKCLESILWQDYPREKLEIIIVDGGSVDKTVEIARKLGMDKILLNKLRTGEAGKALGIRHSHHEIIAFIDSDNILDRPNWLKDMIKPFADLEIVISEALYWTYDRVLEIPNRYSALSGVNDPFSLFLGNYGRFSYLTGRWTDIPLRQAKKDGYLKVEVHRGLKMLPTLGANGCLVKRTAFDNDYADDYFFDVDFVYRLLAKGCLRFARVKVGVTHCYAKNTSQFILKTIRRIRDYFIYSKKGLRMYPYEKIPRSQILKFLLYTITLFPLLLQIKEGNSRRQDVAWLFHVPACWITMLTYAIYSLVNQSTSSRFLW